MTRSVVIMVGIVLTGLLLQPSGAVAQSRFLVFDIPYLVFDIPEYRDGLWYYSELDNYPEMFGFVLMSTTTVHLTIDAVDHTRRAPGISGILVKDQGAAGVQEVGRFLAGDVSWDIFTDRRTRMEYRAGPSITRELGPGNYRVEVSMPTNEGRYVLKLGPSETPKSANYVDALREIRATQDFHGFGVMHMFLTSHVYLPILILFFLLGIAGTFWYARRKQLL